MTARDIAKREFHKETALALEKEQQFPDDIWKKAAESGLIGIHLDEKYMGGGLGILDNVLLAEELCRNDSTFGSALMLSAFGCKCILRFDDKETKNDFLPLVVEGAMLAGAAFSEKGQNGDITAIQTTAKKTNDEWVINGNKAHVINGGKAGFYSVLCRTDPSNTSPSGISMILIEGDRHGLHREESGQRSGLKMTDVSDLYLDDVYVPDYNLKRLSIKLKLHSIQR